jgi:signal transduction histidine kinase
LDNRKNQLELEERRIDLMQKNMQMKEERIRIAAVLTGQENERKRLSRELHDGIGQMLTAIKLKFEMIDYSTVNDPILEEKLNDIKTNIRKTIFETRKISQDLMPSALEDFGFSSALRVLTEEFSLIKGIKVVFKDRKLKNELPSEVRISLFRIVQEALANITKHSDAKKVTVEVAEADGVVSLFIKDNGTTFRLEDIGKGLGINNMRERTELLNGLFIIKNTEENGCEISISIPLQPIEVSVLK